MSDEQLVMMFCDETLYTFERAGEHMPSTFGGPLEDVILGLPTGARSLHMLARLALSQIPQIWSRHRIFDLPLVYGFTYDGCEVRYRFGKPGKIEVLELDPRESSEDFPYLNYPPLLPYVPLRISEARPCPYPEFAEEIPNMAAEQPSELVVAVPPPATLGVSLWGRMGDAEGVTVVFECSLTDRTVRAYNRCT